MNKLIECVPNFSEGRDLSVIQRIREAIESNEGVTVLHVTSDAWHNRSVITFVAPSDRMVDAAFAGIKRASELIDLSGHLGVHPRMGAADVVPFVPLGNATMEDCVAIANQVGRRVGDELRIPVYLYENAATTEERRNLAVVRRGGYERVREEIVQPGLRTPDYGPSAIHVQAGAIAIGARPFLIAFNVYIGPLSQMGIAKEVAKTVRWSNGGMEGIKALALEVDGQAQVSLNIVDINKVTLKEAFDAVSREVALRGGQVEWSEIIGLVPEKMVFEGATAYLRLRDTIESHTLERLLRLNGIDW